MKSILNKKISISLLLFVFLVLFINTFSYCAVTYTMSDGNDVTFENIPVDENPDYFIFYAKSSVIGNNYYYITYNSLLGDFLCINKDTFAFSSSSPFNIYRISENNLSGNFSLVETGGSFNYGEKAVSFYSNRDVYLGVKDGYSYVSSGEILFTGAPLPQVVEPMKITQVQEIIPAMMEIAKMIIPVCLIIFGTLLVVYLIKSKNLLQL